MRRVFMLIVAGGLVALIVQQQAPPPPEPPAIELHRTAAASFFEPTERGVLFVLIIGSDVREGDPRGGRADSLHLLAVNTKTGTGTLIGIPRDSYVPIPGRGTNKINASLFFGGPQSTVQTVSQLARVPIHYWALIEFSRFRNLVDALGGVEVRVPYPMADTASGAVFPAGLRKMDGTEALAFSRARKTIPGGDFGRSENQGRVLVAALVKFQKETKRPLSVAKYLSSFRSLVQANVKTSELLDLVRLGRSLKAPKIRNVVLPGGGGSAGGASVVFLGPGATDIFDKIRNDGVL